MTRSQSLLGLLFLTLTGLTFAWCNFTSPTSLVDEEGRNSVNANEKAPSLTELKLMARIESLEKRISRLEHLETVVRQADSSHSDVISAPRELPTVNPDDGKYQPQQTNGTSWSFRTLSHRRTSNLVR